MNEIKLNPDLPAVGVDIAKAKFDACLGRAKPVPKTFDNTPEGCAALLGWLAQHGVTQAPCLPGSHQHLRRRAGPALP